MLNEAKNIVLFIAYKAIKEIIADCCTGVFILAMKRATHFLALHNINAIMSHEVGKAYS